MKQKILSAGFALALLVSATVVVQESKKNDVVLNDLALANIEALANGESGQSRKGYIGDYKWINVGDYITRIPCCKKVTEQHSLCDAMDDC